MSAAIKVLLIDDEEHVREALTEEIGELNSPDADEVAWDVRSEGFDSVEATLATFRPDMVVLDLIEGKPPDANDSGNDSFELIRNVWFCPVVVYTAHAPSRAFDEHPLVVQVVKGRNSDQEVVVQLLGFTQIAQMIRAVHSDFDDRVRDALHDSVHALSSQFEQTMEGPESEVLRRAVRRLVAARVDESDTSGGSLEPWERFVIPPVGNHLLTADILRLSGADCIAEDAFRLVLTPSCDLAQFGDDPPKAEHVLVAKCEPLKKIGGVQLKSETSRNKRDKQRERIARFLREGISGAFVPIPRFSGHVPLMIANLKRLDLIPWNSIELGGRGACAKEGLDAFERVASTDSPFREMVVWAYLRTTGRPGMPEVNIESWVNQVEESLDTDDQT